MKAIGSILCPVTVLLALLCPACTANNTLPETIQLDSGTVSGVRVGAVRSFKGIPYAAPPLRNLRWKPPQPPVPWDGVRAMDQFGPPCIQPDPRKREFPQGNSEDCLFLNVWTAANSADARLPVMVWVHGGSFTIGSGSKPEFDGSALATKGAVVVTLNYRLGALGFMAHPELTRESGHGASGNYGLLDITAALEWVRRNIASFGGDPDRVTLFGQSSGSMCIAILMASPHAKSLFHRAIGQSGGLNTGEYRTLARREQSYAKLFGDASLSDLRGMAAEEIATKAAGNAFIDGWLLPDDPTRVFERAEHIDVPLLVGSNRDEDDADRRARTIQEWAQLAAKPGKSKAFVYYFTHQPPAEPGASTTEGGTAVHSAEIPYVFGNLIGDRAWTDSDRRLSQIMSSYWVNFAANGDPNGAGLPHWPAFEGPATNTVLLLGDQPATGSVLNHDQN